MRVFSHNFLFKSNSNTIWTFKKKQWGYQNPSSWPQSTDNTMVEQSHLLHSPDNKLVLSFFFKKANNSYLPIPALPPALLFNYWPRLPFKLWTGVVRHPACLRRELNDSSTRACLSVCAHLDRKASALPMTLGVSAEWLSSESLTTAAGLTVSSRFSFQMNIAWGYQTKGIFKKYF